MARRISIAFIRLSLGFFFVVLGFAGILPTVNESVFGLNGGSQTLEIVFGIVELVCGAYLAVGFFVTMRKQGSFIASLIVLFFWLARMALTKIVWGIHFSNAGLIFHGGFYNWLLVLSAELIVLSALGILLKANEQ